MSDFAASWYLSRKRFLDEIAGLRKDQLNWKLHPNCLSIGQMAIHVAGVEVSFGSQLAGKTLDEFGEKVRAAATEGVVNEDPFPFTDSEIDPALVDRTLQYSRAIWEPLITEATGEMRAKELKSALGPIIDGQGAFARLGFHSAYHQGQAYLIKTAPGFPS